MLLDRVGGSASCGRARRPGTCTCPRPSARSSSRRRPARRSPGERPSGVIPAPELGRVSPLAELAVRARASRTSRAPFETTTSDAWPTMSRTPMAVAGMTSTRGRLRKLMIAAVSSASTTTSVGRRASHLVSIAAAVFVDGSLSAPASRTATLPRSAWTESAARSALRRALRLTLTVYLRGFGPKATPPPRRWWGTLSAPTRARPVPFWRQALAPVIETSPRPRVEAVPRRRAAGLGAGDLEDEGAVEALAKEGGGQVGLGLLAERRGLGRRAGCRRASHRCAPRRCRSSGRGRRHGAAAGCARRRPRRPRAGAG